MKKILQSLVAVLMIGVLVASLARAASIPQPFSTLPYVYSDAFPAARLNANFAYALSYVDSIVAGNMSGNAATATSAVFATTASSVPYTGLTGTVPTWNQNTTGNAATASSELPTWAVVTASAVVANGSYNAADTSAVAFTLTLPASGVSNRISFLDATNTFSTHSLVIAPASGVNLNSAGSNVTISTSGATVMCVYLNTAIGYRCVTQ